MEENLTNKRENLIVNLTEDFAINIIAFHRKVKKTGNESMADQLFRSGTSIGANVSEAQGAESRRDFVHKLKISSKEAEETEYWLKLCKRSEFLPDPGELQNEIRSINRVLSKIIYSCKQNKNTR